MKKLFWGILLLTLTAVPAFALDLNGWYTDFSEAQKVAREKNLPMYVLFTGSDWCPYCIKLEKDVLNKPQFMQAVKERYILVYLDFPRRKAAPKEAAANQKLAAEYKVAGFPTALILNAQGREVARLISTAPLNDYLKKLNSAVR